MDQVLKSLAGKNKASEKGTAPAYLGLIDLESDR